MAHILPAMRKLIISLALAPCLAGCGKDHRPIELGVVLTLGDSGVAPMLRGARLAVTEINAGGGVRVIRSRSSCVTTSATPTRPSEWRATCTGAAWSR